MIPARIVSLLFVLVALISCGRPQDRSPALGQAFVGPSTLNLRQEVSTKAAVSATVHHGEPLEILEYKRRFIKVRTAGGIVGWTETHELMTPGQMADLRHAAERAANYPSQGIGTTFEPLNVHTEPSRASPSFLQVPEGGKVDVIGHKITPRAQAPPPIPAPPPKPRPQRRRKEKTPARIPPPPMPPAPKLPSNWMELSKTPESAAAPKPEAPKAPPAPVQMDDWSLIRTRDGRVGWVLSRMLNMAIPDDVAQYAEGRRITAYFPMGDVRDEDQVKHNWLWTTIGKGPLPYEFDSFRFFIWSQRHHRYETAYIQRDVIGHYPVEVKNVGDTHSFTVTLEDEDGKLYKKTYAFNGYRVNLVESVPYAPPTQPPAEPSPNPAVEHAQSDDKAQSWLAGMKAKFAKLFHAR